jgi:hypothetical protein
MDKSPNPPNESPRINHPNESADDEQQRGEHHHELHNHHTANHTPPAVDPHQSPKKSKSHHKKDITALQNTSNKINILKINPAYLLTAR